MTAVSACKYSLPQPDHAGHHRGIMVSSLRLEGPNAAAAMNRVVAAPVGGGPDDPSSCLPEYSYGDDAIVLRVTADRGQSEVYLRYSGCDHNGFDDGTTVRTLTADAVAPFVAGANEVTGFSGRGKTEVLRPGSQ